MTPPATVPTKPNKLEEALRKRTRGDVRFDQLTRSLYSTDASMYQVEPVAVVIPESTEDVVQIVRTAAEFNTPVLARGSGSSLAGQTVGNAIVIDFTRHLDSILDIDPDEKTARVQPGVVLDDLNRAAAKYGLMVGPDPASSNRATLGGMVANNATGTHSILYGNVIRHIRYVDVVLADGSTATLQPAAASVWEDKSALKTFEGTIHREILALLEKDSDTVREHTSKHWRRNSGYRLEGLLDVDEPNLASLICGSEGTLAVVTEIGIALVERPDVTGLAVVHFESRREALESVTTILSTSPSAIELFDGATIRQCRQMAGIAERMTFVEGDPGAVLMTEYYGETRNDIDRAIVRLKGALTDQRQGYATVEVHDADRIADAWSVRKEALGFIMGVRGDYQPLAFIEDASVPAEHLADYIDEVDSILKETGTSVVYYAHASGGCLHVRPFINLKDRAEIDKMHDIAARCVDLVARYGGAFSSEHGDGLARSEFNRRLVGDELYEVYRRVKQIFDPDNILNPGKIIDAPAMTENLRYGSDYRTQRLSTELDFSTEGGFAGAVEQCTGIGTCRKLHAGTMCPSFMVTRDEIHSTRGRANALRAALAGQLGHDSLTSPEMHGVMDLCIQCKACKTECPSNVDMARIKSEWLSRYWQSNRIPMRTRVFANMPRIAANMPSYLKKISNTMSSSRPTAAIMKKALGVSRDRTLPPFAAKSFTSTFDSNRERHGPPVVLFADTFTNYQHPEIGHAAAELLTRVGYSVFVPQGTLCCGRTYMSKGFVARAQKELLAVVESLFVYAEEDIPVVALEPSCLSMITDDYRSLLPGELRAECVAGAAVSLEELVACDEEALFATAPWSERERGYLVHGHCHQKALEGTAPLRGALDKPGTSAVEVVDSGCCGMAGSFGYEAEHDQISRQMAERVLVPAVKSAGHDVTIVAPGTSCRAQIQDLTGKKALHPAEALLQALVD